ncbi:MAG TPA: ATP-dependent RecD-like DNA helicase [Saprospiraceae bacterium]|nr:ATP-dependent RecD-like DNA helicase [Saprospiraceae bacterium]
MFVKNDPERNFVNGSIGRVVRLDKETVVVEITGDAGQKKRVEVTPVEWEIVRYKSDAADGIDTETLGSFRQYPLKLAWAITIHKSQGKTFDRMMIDLGGGAFEHGQLYVALSRCRTLEGIVLKQRIRPQDVITDERVVDFYSRSFR